MTATTIKLQSRIVRADDLVSADLEGETALMSATAGKYYSLEPVGSRIWALLETPHLVAEICSVLLAEFEVDRERCEQELTTFLNDLAKENLIKVVDEPTV
jgi:hypothetical protein